MQTFDLIIIGGGVVGLTLACLLAADELSIALIDHQPPDDIATLKSFYDIRVSSIHHAAVNIFNALNVWNSMQQLRVSTYHRMSVWDAVSPARIEFDSAEISQSYLGHIVEYSVMRQVLWEKLQTYKYVKIFTETSPQALREKTTTVEIVLDNNTILAAPVLVGADGKNSWVAKKAFPSDTGKQSLFFSDKNAALVTTLCSEYPHKNTAFQRFLPTGPVALLPLADSHLISLVWSTTQISAASLKKLPETEFNLQLAQAVEYVLGNLTACDQRLVFPLLSHQAPHYVKARVALVGDCAHTILPLAGQGLNLGLLDAACLAQVLAEAHKKEKDLGGILTLRRYERWRKGENTAMLLAMEGFNRCFGSQTEVLRHMRHLGFAATKKIPWIKKYFMQRAAGLRGELPEKARS